MPCWWYVVFHRRVRGIYSSWRLCQDQVNGYSNNNYQGYETLEESQQEYLTFLEEELLEDHAIDEAVPLAQLSSEEVHALQGAPPMIVSVG
jgi:viroplasmin and RNaseH domain-containing protein